MNLIQSLATGVPGAESGTAEIYKRGTSTFATLYADYDASGAVTPSTGVALDTSGRATWFVNESVYVVVKDSTGQVVDTFTDMLGAPLVEVRSQSFTGVDYTTAQSAAGNPITLAAVLDKWRLSAGALDWNVLVGSSTLTLAAAFASVSGLFYNVKATSYGAIGDGATNDGSAIQAAIDAASTAGGGIVFFPAGTYRITSAITLKNNVSLFGAGSGGTKIKIDHASNNAVSVNAGTANQAQFIKGLTVEALQSNSGKMLVVESGTVLVLEECTIGGSLVTGKGISLANAATRVTCIGCHFVVNAANAYHVNGTGGPFAAIRCRFVWSATNATTSSVLADMMTISGCEFDLSAITNAGANGAVLEFNVNTGPTFILASKIVAPAVGTAMQDIVQGGTASGWHELGWVVPTNITQVRVRGVSAVGNHEGAFDAGRESRRYYVTDNAAAITVSPDLYGVIEVRRTNNGNQTVNISAAAHAGMNCRLTWNNDHAAGGGTITLSTVKGLANFTVNANSVSHYYLTSVENVAAGAGSSNIYWALVGSSVNVTP